MQCSCTKVRSTASAHGSRSVRAFGVNRDKPKVEPFHDFERAHQAPERLLDPAAPPRADTNVVESTSYASPDNYGVKPYGNDSYGIDDYTIPQGPGGGGGDEGGPGGGGDGDADHNGSGIGSFLTAVLAVGVIAGGAMGYKKKGSKASAMAGGSVGVSLLVAAALMVNGGTVVAGYRIAFVMSAVLAGVMGKRYLTSKKVMPAGAVAGVSVVYAGGYLLSGFLF